MRLSSVFGRGMTLVELLIVFSILGLLASLVGPAAYRQVERTKSQEEWLMLRRAVRDLGFNSYTNGESVQVEFAGSMLKWRYQDGTERQLLFEQLFFDPRVETRISSNGVFGVEVVRLRQRQRLRTLALNEWTTFEVSAR